MKRTYHSYKPFIDLFLLLTAGLTLMFMVSFMMIRPEITEDKKNIEAKAEIIVTVTWPTDRPDDVDTYVEDSADNLVYFSRREDGLMTLDRDDQGEVTDRVYYAPGKYIEYKENREIVTIRGLVPGRYTVNVHMYNKRIIEETPVYVTVEKLNPHVRLFVSRTVMLVKKGDEQTITQFTVDGEGNVSNINEEQKSLAAKKLDPEHYNLQDQDLHNFDPESYEERASE